MRKKQQLDDCKFALDLAKDRAEEVEMDRDAHRHALKSLEHSAQRMLEKMRSLGVKHDDPAFMSLNDTAQSARRLIDRRPGQT